MTRPTRPSELHGQLPGGRAPYYGKDAYTSQMNEYDFRRGVPGFPFQNQGQYIRDVEFAAGETKEIQHALRRPYLGFVPLNVQARPCAFKAYLSANQTGLASGSNVKINFDTEQYDYGNVFNTTTSLFTAPVTGLYEFTLLLWVSSIDAGQYFSGRLFAGGSTRYGGFNHESAVTGSYIQRDSFTLRLTAGQTAEAQGRLSGGTAVSVLGSAVNESNFSGRILGEATPYIDSASAADTSRVIALHAERPFTCDLWVY